MITSRRSFIAGIAAAFAAPAIVRASSLMPVRAYSDELITRCDVLYGHLGVRVEWLGLDEFTDRIRGPMIKRFQQSVANEIMSKSTLDESFINGSQWGSKLIYNKERRTIVRTVIPTSEVFNVT